MTHLPARNKTSLMRSKSGIPSKWSPGARRYNAARAKPVPSSLRREILIRWLFYPDGASKIARDFSIGKETIDKILQEAVHELPPEEIDPSNGFPYRWNVGHGGAFKAGFRSIHDRDRVIEVLVRNHNVSWRSIEAWLGETNIQHRISSGHRPVKLSENELRALVRKIAGDLKLPYKPQLAFRRDKTALKKLFSKK